MFRVIQSMIIMLILGSFSTSFGQRVGQTYGPVTYTQEQLHSYIAINIDIALNDPDRTNDPKKFIEGFHYSCLAIRDYLIVLEDSVKRDEFVNSLKNFPIDYPQYKAHIITALSGIIHEDPRAYKYIIDSISDKDYNTKRAVAISLLANDEYNLVKDIIIEEELFYLLLSFNVEQSIPDLKKVMSSASPEGKRKIAYFLEKFEEKKRE